MKKLFFSALVAVVAVGGAFVTKASTSKFAPIVWQADGTQVDCGGSVHSCTAEPLYNSPDVQDETTLIDPSELAGLRFN